MVTNLVGNHIGIGEGITLDTKLALHLREERQVDVEFLVARAIERANGCCSRTTGRLYLIREQHECGRRVSTAHLLEYLTPHILGRGKNLLTIAGKRLLLFGKVLLTDGLSGCRHLFLSCLQTS